jgi:hypothetical protein
MKKKPPARKVGKAGKRPIVSPAKATRKNVSGPKYAPVAKQSQKRAPAAKQSPAKPRSAR